MKQVKLDEMLELLNRINHPQAPGMIAALESVGTHMASIIADHFGLHSEPATFEGIAFAGLCASIGPATADQEIPEEMEDIDPSAGWHLGSQEPDTFTYYADLNPRYGAKNEKRYAIFLRNDRLKDTRQTNFTGYASLKAAERAAAKMNNQ